MVQDSNGGGGGGGKRRNRNRKNKNKNKSGPESQSGSAVAAAPDPSRSRSGSEMTEGGSSSIDTPGSAQATGSHAPSGRGGQSTASSSSNGQSPPPAAAAPTANRKPQKSVEELRAELARNLAKDNCFPADWLQLKEAEKKFHENMANKSAAAKSASQKRAPVAAADSDNDLDFFADDDEATAQDVEVKVRPSAAKQKVKQEKKAKKKSSGAAAEAEPPLFERTLVLLKPDAVQRGLIGDIVSRIESRGFTLVGAKLVRASEALLRRHYADLAAKAFFSELIRYMMSGPVLAMVWQGLDCVETLRTMVGATNPAEARPGTIRGDFCIDIGRNLIHASDLLAAADREMGMWFENTNELVQWRPCQISMIYDDGQVQGENNPIPVDGIAAMAVNEELVKKVAKLENENATMKKVTDDLRNLVLKLEGRVNSLESGKPKAAAAAKPADDDDDEDVDLFGSDDDEEEESADAKRVREERLAAYAAKKSKKPAVIAKTSVLLDVKPWDDETDMDAMLKAVKSIEKDGLLWGASKLVPVGYGVSKLQVLCVVEDEKVSIEELSEQIEEFEDYVQSVDVSSMQKI